MKVVIHHGVGSFSVSREAVLWLRERGYEPALWPNEVLPGERWGRDTQGVRDREFMAKSFYMNDVCGDLMRSDALLVECVEALGDKVNGEYSDLRVVEVPDDVRWYIEAEDCGSEHIAEVHRTWA